VREVLWASSDYKGWVFSLEFITSITKALNVLLAAHPVGLTEEQVRPLVDALIDISEYWNGHTNERAMTDACEHTRDLAHTTLANWNRALLSLAPTHPMKDYRYTERCNKVRHAMGYELCPGCELIPVEPAPASDVDLVQKIRDVKWQSFIGPLHSAGMYDAAKWCADELAAWLPAHDAKVRAGVLEEAAQVEYYDRECGGMMPLPKAARDAIRALAGPSRGGKT